MKHTSLQFIALVLVCAFASPAAAQFRMWGIQEIYSNADGSIQYIELFTTEADQNLVIGHGIRAVSDDNEVETELTMILEGSTANQHLLLATPGFASLPGAVEPDFTLPCGPFFDPKATTIAIDFVGADQVDFLGESLPTDGVQALIDSMPEVGAIPDELTPTLAAGANSPTNFAGDVGSLQLEGCQLAGTCGACDDGVFCNGAESCGEGVCQDGSPPCPQDECREAQASCGDEPAEPNAGNDEDDADAGAAGGGSGGSGNGNSNGGDDDSHEGHGDGGTHADDEIADDSDPKKSGGGGGGCDVRPDRSARGAAWAAAGLLLWAWVWRRRRSV